jgi:uncharacterized protein (DUF983 family)
VGPAQRAARLVGRALLLRCPGCGRAGVVRAWLTMTLSERCSECGLRLDRGEEGFFLGAVLFNLIAAELCFVVGLVGVLVLTWPNPPWDGMFWGGIALMILLPIVFFPFSKTLWLAFDMIFRPSLPGDHDPRSGA